MYQEVFQTTNEVGWTPVSDWRFESHAPQRIAGSSSADWMHSVPALPTTVLGLDLLLQEPSIDLRAASELVLSDLGATLQVLRLIGSEYGNSSERPCSMNACLSSLDVKAWFSAISSHTLSAKRDTPRINSVWNHCRTVGQYAKLIAETLDGVSPDEAFMVGLLHEIETVPQLLSSRDSMYSRDSLTIDQVIPHFVLTALDSAKERGSSSVWRYILSSAHALAAATPGFDIFNLQQR